MAALELVTAQATAPGTGAAMAAVAGNSLTLRDTRLPIYLIDLWQQRQAAGLTRIVSPQMHDAIVGLQGVGPIGHGHLYRGWESRLYAQDTLAITATGSATAGDIETSCWLVYYEQLPGINTNLIDASELERRGEDVYTFTATLALGTGGGYTGSEAITAEQDQLKANTEYAWLGATVQVGAAAVRMVGPDFGNLGIGLPASVLTSSPASGWHSAEFFRALSRELGAPLVPVINSANKSLTTVDGVTDENGTDAVVVYTLVRLAPRAGGTKKGKGS